MKFFGKTFLILFLILLFSLTGFTAQLPIPIFVTIMPQVYLVERIGGDRVIVDALVLPGKNSVTYTPSFKQMMGLARAKIFFRIGVPMENGLMPKIKNIGKQVLIIDTRKGIKMRRMERGHHHHHHDGEGGLDPHIWLDPKLVKIQAKTIYEALVQVDPEGLSEYTSGLNSFIADLDLLDKKIKATFAPVHGSSFFVFHPAFGYFADAYGFKQVAVEIEGKAPKGKDLSAFVEKAIKENARVIFVQPQFDKTAAKKIAKAINGTVVSIDPLAKDYLKNMEKIADLVADAFGN